jgi:hypothetical protein
MRENDASERLAALRPSSQAFSRFGDNDTWKVFQHSTPALCTSISLWFKIKEHISRSDAACEYLLLLKTTLKLITNFLIGV